MNRDPLRIVFLAGADARSTRSSIEAVCRPAATKPVAVLLDNSHDSFKLRVKNLRRNVAQEGIGHAVSRFFKALRAASDQFATRAGVSHGEVDELLRKAFPERCFTREDVAARHGFAVHRGRSQWSRGDRRTALPARLGEAGHQTVLTNFSAEMFARSVTDLYARFVK